MNTTTLKQLHAGNDLAAMLADVEARIRQAPQDEASRWALVELLCIQGDWQRALRQVQSLARISQAWQAQAHLVRSLIRAEMLRGEVFSGKRPPVPVIDLPSWMTDLFNALAHNAHGRTAQADALRAKALEQAPSHAGSCTWQTEASARADQTVTGSTHSEQAYAWIGDSDTRLGPVCEVIVSGAYRWLAFADIAQLELDAPQRPLDLVWMPARIQLRGTQAAATPLHCFIPARYCGTEVADAGIGSEQQNALLLSRLTVWTEVGETGVFARGQKTWMTEGFDWPLLDVRSLRAVESKQTGEPS